MKKLPPDSILRVTDEILKIDPRSKLALGNAIEAYDAKGDTTKAIQASIQLYRADPSNQSLIQSIINKLATMGRPDIAIPLIDDLLKDNPADPQMLRTKWLLYLASKDWKNAITAGEEYVKVDTAAANADYFTRMVAAAASDSQPQLAAQYGARAVQKFPNDASLHMLYAISLRKAGQLQQAVGEAEKAVAVDPKVDQGYPTILVTWAELNQPDSLNAWAQKALTAGVDTSLVGNAMLATVQPLMKKAGETKARADYQAALAAAQHVDSLSPSPTTKYFIGVASFQIGMDVLQNINKTKSCDEAKLADDMWATSQIAMPQGASVSKEAAGQILGLIQQYSQYITQAKKAFCKGK
jgi:tetratricopeptide (TPR) repeat protein